MRPNASGYCAHENGLQATNPIRNLTNYPAAHTTTSHIAQHPQLRHPPYSWSEHAHGYNAPQRPQQAGGVPAHAHSQNFGPPPLNQHPHLQRKLPPVQYHHGNGFPASSHHPPPPPMLQDMVAHNYAKLPPPNAVNQQRINDCAGIPLISTASSHLTATQRQRVQRKSSHSPPHSQKSAESRSAIATQYNWHNMHGGSYVPSGQLAGHAQQGVPLHQHQQQQQQQQQTISSHTSSSSNSNAYNWNAAYLRANSNRFLPHGGSPPSPYKTDKSRTLRYQSSAPAALNSRTKENSGPPSLKDASQSLSPDASKDLSEACLPRIIKPRKRRKKDRKPANGVFLKLDSEVEESSLPNCRPHKSSTDMLNTMTRYSSDLTNLTENSFDDQQLSYQKHSLPQQFVDLPQQSKSFFLNASKRQHPAAAHGICFCQTCEPLRSIWDYPLRRSLSDSSATSSSEKSSISSTSSDTASSSSGSTTTTQTSDVVGVDTFSPITTTRSRAEIVGVIGSNRASHDTNSNSNSNRNSYATSSVSSQHNNAPNHTFKPTTNGCLSDSNDSGYGDILGGINIADDLFNHANNSATALTTSKSATSLLLRPETAETLLTESINEISRKLMETCANEVPEMLPPPPSTTSLSSFDFSNDSGIDSAGSGKGSGAIANIHCNELVFNFDHLNIVASTCNSSPSSSSATLSTSTNFPHAITNTNTSTTSTRTTHTNFLLTPTMDLLLDLNNNNTNNNNKGLSKEGNHHFHAQQHNQQFFNNCFDLVWQNALEDSTTSILGSVGKLKTAFSSIS